MLPDETIKSEKSGMMHITTKLPSPILQPNHRKELNEINYTGKEEKEINSFFLKRANEWKFYKVGRLKNFDNVGI